MFIALFIGWRTPETVVFMSLVLVWNAGIVSTSEALSGFSNEGMLAVGALFVVVKGVERSQLADKAARRVFGLDTSLRSGLLRLMVLCFLLSAFLNNTPVVALLIPITRDWARTRGFSPSQLLIPLSYSCIFGGLLTVIGTSTNLVVQGLVKDEGLPGMEFFEPGYIGLPLGMVGMVYLLYTAPRFLPSHGGLFRYVRDKAEELLTEVQVLKDFKHIGEPVSLVLARLGLQQETLIKIRRKVPQALLRQMDMEVSLHTGEHWHSSHGETSSAGGRGAAPVGISRGRETMQCTSKHYYRNRTECLWGTKGDITYCMGILTPSGGADMVAVTPNKGAVNPGWIFSPRVVSGVARTHSEAEEGTASGREMHVESPAPPQLDNERTSGVDSTHNSAGYTDVYPVSPGEVVQGGDILFLSCGQMAMISFQGSTMSQGLEGLKLLDVNALDLPGRGTDFFELVVSDRNHFVGHSAGEDNSAFGDYYSCSVVAVRRKGSFNATSVASKTPGSFVAREASAHIAASISTSMNGQSGRDVEGNQQQLSEAEALSPSVNFEPTIDQSQRRTRGRTASSEESRWRLRPRMTSVEDARDLEVAHRPLQAGDVVLVLAKENFIDKWAPSQAQDFFLVTNVGSVPKPVRLWDYVPLGIFAVMLAWVTAFGVDMVRGAFAAGALLVLGGWVDARKAVGFVNWGLLLLIGSALGLSRGISNSGLAGYVGGAIRDSGISPEASIFVLYAFTMVRKQLLLLYSSICRQVHEMVTPPLARWCLRAGLLNDFFCFLRISPQKKSLREAQQDALLFRLSCRVVLVCTCLPIPTSHHHFPTSV
ncbi:unnamed protein product [Choristocarpus tenellus]